MSNISIQLPDTLHKSLIAPTGFGVPVSQQLPEAVRRIVETLHPEKIILFGSYARGNPTSDSDVDLLVIMETDLPVTCCQPGSPQCMDWSKRASRLLAACSFSNLSSSVFQWFSILNASTPHRSKSRPPPGRPVARSPQPADQNPPAGCGDW